MPPFYTFCWYVCNLLFIHKYVICLSQLSIHSILIGPDHVLTYSMLANKLHSRYTLVCFFGLTINFQQQSDCNTWAKFTIDLIEHGLALKASLPLYYHTYVNSIE